MKRRNFVKSGVALSTIPAACVTSKMANPESQTIIENELYEWRSYEIKWGTNAQPLISYLKEALQPAMKRAGVNHFMLFEEIAPGGPKKIYALISYPTAQIYLGAQHLQDDAAYVSAASAYDALAPDQAIYHRYSSDLLQAFDGLKQMMNPVDGATVFELRTYEGYSEDAVRRKIMMFDDEEIPLFLKVGLNPVFFGNMLSGPYRPCLVYMINFTDMDAHAAAWKAFLDSPEWNAMKVLPKYANTLSNIRNTFLKVI